MRVAEVTVRFAGTILDIVHVRPGDQFRIGSAPGVELAVAVPGITEFPIVDARDGAFVVRRPVGTYATRNALAMQEPDARLATSDRIELWFANVLVTVELIVLAGPPLARPPADRRPAGYVAASLAAHLVMWSVAIVFASPAAKPRPHRMVALRPRLVHVATREPKHPPPPPRDRAAHPAAIAATHPHVADPITAPDVRSPTHELPPMGDPMTEGPKRLADLIGKLDVAGELSQTGPRYDPDDVHEGDFGKGLRFDPDTRPGFDTIKTGRYQTVSTGFAAGEHYSIEAEHARVHVRLCEDDACTADGGLTRAEVDYRLGYKLRQFAHCYQPETETLVFELVIGPDGKVRESHGPGRAGGCIARVASAVTFPKATDETHVSYSVMFVPPT